MGTVFVEVWVQNDNFTQLRRPEGGYWMDPVFHDTSAASCSTPHEHCSPCSIANPYYKNFIDAQPVAPGVGLAGVLWSESIDVGSATFVGPLPVGAGPMKRKIVWRDLRAMANNPHLSFDNRLNAIVDSGLGWAAGVPFNINSQKGIVIYMARKTVDHEKLKDAANELYLQSAADLIGSAWALRGPRNAAMQERRAARDAALRRVKIKLSFLVRMGAKFDYIASPPGEIASDQFRKNVLDDEESRCFEMTKRRGAEMCTKTKVVVAQTAKKCLGSNNRPPPPFSNSQSLFTFVGSFVSLAVLAGISFALVDSFGGDYLLVMPPFGGTRAGAC
jgi:hypothetical protein